MNEELLKAIYDTHYSQFAPFDEFKKDIMSSPEFRNAVYKEKGYDKHGTYESFEKDLGVSPQGIQPLPNYQQGPIGVERPGIMANPGINDEKLTDYYKVNKNKLTSSILAAGPAKESMTINPVALQEIEKESGINREKKAAEWINRPGDVLTVAKEIYGTDLGKKKEKYSNDPQIADAEFSFEALNHFRENLRFVSDRSKERLKLLYKDKYSEPEIEKLINTHTALSLMGNVQAANKMKAEHPELFGDPNSNNIIAANQRLRDTASAENHVIKNNPNWLKRQRTIADKQEDIDESVVDYRDKSTAEKILMASPLGGPMALAHPNIGQTVKGRIGAWAKNLAVGPGMRDWGRDMMEFNPKSSDFQGRAIETYKPVTVGGKKYDVVFDGDKVEYIRDAATGFMVKPEAAEMKAIKEKAATAESKSRFNTKPFIGQTSDVLLDMAPIIALTYATGGIGSSLGMSLSTARGMGVVAGSMLQTRGDLIDQMLLHPDISPAEAEMYTLGIGLGVGAISLINPIEAKVISGSIAGVAKKNIARFTNKEITKGQLAWEITKDVGRTAIKEPVEELLQEGWQWVALNELDRAKKEKLGRFDNPVPGFAELGEIALVSAAVGLLGGAGSIRTNRNAFIDEALEMALAKPKLVEDYFAEMEVSANGAENDAKKQESLDHIARLRSRWESVKGNVEAVKNLDKKKRGHLAALIADANQLEAELGGVTNEAVKASNLAEIKKINEEIKNLISPKSAAAPAAAAKPTPILDEDDDADADIDSEIVDNLGLFADGKDVEVQPDYFEEGQRVEDENGPGTIEHVNLNFDKTIHSVEIKYDLPDTGRDTYTEDERRPNRTVIVARKTPMETGIKILGDGKKAADDAVNPLQDVESTTKSIENATGDVLYKLLEIPGIGRSAPEMAANYHAAKADESNPELVKAVEELLAPKPKTKASIPLMITKKMEADLRTKGYSQDQIDKLTPQEANDILQPTKPGAKTTDGDPGKTDQKDSPSTKGNLGTTNDGGTKTDGEIPEQSGTPGSTTTGPGTSDADKTKSGLETEDDPELRAEIDKETVRLTSERDEAIKGIEELAELDPDLNIEEEKKRINEKYEKDLTQSEVTARVNVLKNTRDDLIRKAKTVGKARKVPQSAIDGTVERIKNKYNTQINDLEKSVKSGKFTPHVKPKGKDREVRQGEGSAGDSQGQKTIGIRKKPGPPTGKPGSVLAKAREALKIAVGNNPVALAMQFLLDNQIHSGVIRSLYGGKLRSGDERKIQGEVTARLTLIDNSSPINTPAELGKAIWEYFGMPDDITDQDFRSAAEEVLQNYKSRREIADFLLKQFTAPGIEEQLEWEIANADPDSELAAIYAVSYVDMLSDEEFERLLEDEYEFQSSPEFAEMLAGEVAPSEEAASTEAIKEIPPTAPTKTDKRKIRDDNTRQQIADDLAALKAQLKKRDKLTAGGIDPEALAIATRLVGRYVKAGVHKFSDIVEDLYTDLGEDLKDLFQAIKAAYGAYLNAEATDEEAEQMDGSIRAFTYEDLTKNLQQDDQTPEVELPPVNDALKIPTTVRELANLEAEEQNGLLSGLVLSTLNQGDVINVGPKTLTVTRKTKPKKVEYDSGKNKGSYVKTSLTITGPNDEKYTFEMWDDWVQNGSKMLPLIYSRNNQGSNLSRDIEGDITVDLLNENNSFHTPSDSFKIIQKALTRKSTEDVPDRPRDRQPDRQNVSDQESSNDETVPGEDRGSSRGDRGGDSQGGRKKGQSTSSPSLFDLFAPPIDEQIDNELRQEDEGSESQIDSTGSVDGRGNSFDRSERSAADGQGSDAIDSGTTKTSESFNERVRVAKIQQKKAEPIEITLLDEDNIRATLPILLPEQQDDVLKTEKRFFSPEHKTKAKANGKGMMLTNGTGTGKTFSALGVVKRFAKQGKQNILIVTPSQPNIKSWKKAGGHLVLNITQLEGTNDGGQGIVITTFANFRANQELLKRDFDLIVYDESHRLLEAKGGKESNTTGIHEMMGNKNINSALRRLETFHPLWKKERELVLELRANELLKKKPNPDYFEIKSKEKEIENKLVEVRQAQKREEPEMRRRAQAAVENTKAIFLSATPFKEHKNLRYANGFLFDWGDEEITNNQGSRVDAESRFFLEHFGSAYEWKYHRLQQKSDASPDAIAMQEIAFAEKLMADGVMSGRAIESDRDYSREFPKVAGFNSDGFNQAFGDIFNYDKREFNFLRNAAVEVFYNYNYTTQLFEALKASMSIDRIKKHLALDRKVVVFHRRRQAEVTQPFETIYSMTIFNANAVLQNEIASDKDKEEALEAIAQAENFKEKYAPLFEYEKTLDYRSALEQMEAAFPGRVGYINGSISTKKKNQAIESFNTDGSNIDIIVVQEEAGKEGISLHDTTGKNQRVLLSLSMPISTTTALQVEGRIYRIGQETDAIFEYPLLGLDIETAYFGRNINKRLSTTENLAMGNQSRDLIRSYAEGVLFNSSTDDPNVEQGKGGKEYDKRVASSQSEFQKARLVYASNQKVRGRRDQREGVDYFATPEPLGQKMVEWADTRPGDHTMEPSAGHGAIAMWFPTSVTATAIEPSFDLYSKLTGRSGGGTRKVFNMKFEDHNIGNKYDAIVMNPPFGSSGKTAMEHVEKAFKHLRDGGRLVALVPVGQMDKRIENFLYGKDEKGKPLNPHAYLVKEILLPSVTFQQAGTAVNTKIIIIDKVLDEKNAPGNEGQFDIRNAKDINEFFETIEFMDAPPRIAKEAGSDPVTTYSETTSIKPPQVSKVDSILPVEERKNTKTGEMQYSAKGGRFFGSEYRAIADMARSNNGYYSSFAKTFLFDKKEDAEKFRTEVNNKYGSQENAPQFSMVAENIAPELVNGFYSPLEKIISETKLEKLPAKQWIDKFAKGEEAKWTGLADWLQSQDGSVSKSDIQQFLRENRIQIDEVVKSNDTADKEMQRLTEEEGAAREDMRTIARELNTEVSDIYDKYDQPKNPTKKVWVYKNSDDQVVSMPKKYWDRLDKNIAAIDAYNAALDYDDYFDPGPEDMTKYGTYTLPGEKENYKEVLVTLPARIPDLTKQQENLDEYRKLLSEKYGDNFKGSQLTDAEIDKLQELKSAATVRKNLSYDSPHWEEPNILVHLRMDTRTDVDGNKVLFLEELQSDWGQKGKRTGFTPKNIKELQLELVQAREAYNKLDFLNLKLSEIQATPEAQKVMLLEEQINTQTPSAPFVTDTNAWTKLGLKVALKEAVKQGANKIAWTTGEQQNDRYDLSKQVDYIKKVGETPLMKEEGIIYVDISFSTGMIQLKVEKYTGKIIDQTGSMGVSEMAGKQLEDAIGKDIAAKILALDGNEHILKDNDLKIGGKGMRGFYGDPANKKTGIIGNVAKSIFGEVSTTQIATDKGWDVNSKNIDWDKVEVVVERIKAGPNDGQYFVTFAGGNFYRDPDLPYFDTKKEGQKAGEKFLTEKRNESKFYSPQHSVTITPELRQQVQEEGLPMFSMQNAAAQAKTAADIGNPNPNGTIVIRLQNANATLQDRITQYADVWLDLIKEGHNPFYKRGLELIKGTPYDADVAGDLHRALTNAIADRAAKAKKDSKLINWVKSFWSRVAKSLKLNITPEQLQELTVDEYLNIAATALRFGNDIFLELVADGAQVTDVQKPQGPNPEGGPKLQEREAATVKKYEDVANDFVEKKVDPVAKPGPEPAVPTDKKYAFNSRDLNAKTDPLNNPKGPTLQRLLQQFAGDRKKMLETIVLLFPTLKHAGISITLHENPESYWNAVTGHGGSMSQAVNSGGFYRAKQIHINLGKSDLKANTALHEAFHPIIRELLVKDKAAFQRFINDILADPEMRKIYQEGFAKNYQHLANKQDALAEEIIVEATADIVLRRILVNMKSMPDSLFDRVFEYIKKALGEAYGALAQFINTKESFSAFAESMADAISKGMVVPIDAAANDNLRTIIQESIQKNKQGDSGLLFGGAFQPDLFNNASSSQSSLEQAPASQEALRRQENFDRGLLAPNGEPSKLSAAQYAQVRTPEFKAWFGDWENDPENASKVVDENGEPIVLYHGQRWGEKFEIFDNSKQRANIPVGAEAIGHYFGPLEAAKAYAQDGNIYPAFLNIRSPLVTDKGSMLHVLVTPKEAEIYKSQGHDGLIKVDGLYSEHIVFEPNQIKSATDNAGTFDPENPNIYFSIHDQQEQRRQAIMADLRHDVYVNSDVNYEPIVENLIRKGILTKDEVDDILGTWRMGRKHNLNDDQMLRALQDQAELRRMHTRGESDNGMINQAHLVEFVNEYDNELSSTLKRLPPSKVKEMIEDIHITGEASPRLAIELFEEMNRENLKEGKYQTSGGQRAMLVAWIALLEMKTSARSYQQIVDETGDVYASEQVQILKAAMTRLADAVHLNRSIAGGGLGVGSKFNEVAGLTYEGQMRDLEQINSSEAGKGIPIDPKDAETIKRLTMEINALQDVIDKALTTPNPKKNKAAAAEREFNRVIRSGLEARPIMTKAEALELLRRKRAVHASFSLSLSIDPDEDDKLSELDIINQLVKIAHEEIAKAGGKGGFKQAAEKVMSYDPSLTQDQIYEAILSTTPFARQEGLSKYAKVQEQTRKHVKEINTMEVALSKIATNLLRRQKVPSESEMSEFGKLLKEMEKNIYQADANPDLISQWSNALDIIKTNYSLAFLSPEPNKNTEDLIINMLNAARLLKDYKFKNWLVKKELELDAQIALINNGQTSTLVEQEDHNHKVLPDELVVPVIDKKTGHIKLDKNGNIETRLEKFNFGATDRRIREKKNEIERAKAKYRKKNPWLTFYKRSKGTIGSSMAMADISYFGIQGYHQFASTSFRNPKRFYGAFYKSLKVMRDEFSKDPGLANEIHKTQVVETDHYALGMYLGLPIIAPYDHEFINEMLSEDDQLDIWYQASKGKTNIAAKTANKVLGARYKLKQASNAAFATHLNLLLINNFSNYITRVKNATGQDPSMRELKVIVRELSRSVGRTTRLSKKSGEVLAHGFWAPRLYLSTILNIGNIIADPANFMYHYTRSQMGLGGEDMVRAYGHRTINSALFAATTTGLVTLTTLLAKAICGEYAFYTDPAKTNFLKVQCGEMTIDMTGGARQYFALGARLAAAIDGEPYTNYMGQPVSGQEQALNTAKYKLSPLLSFAFQFIFASDFLGRKKIAGDDSWGKWKSRLAVLVDHLTPIAGSNIVDVAQARGVPTLAKPGAIVAAFAGFGVNRIDAEKEAERKRIEKEEKAGKKLQNNADALKRLEKRFGALDELKGKFVSDIPEALEPTSKRFSLRDGTTFRVFKRTDDPGGNGVDDDFYTIRTRKTGKNKGKKVIERIPEEDLDRIR